MLSLIDPNAIDLKTLIPGLNEIRNHPSPYDIYAVEKLLLYMDQDFSGYKEYCQRQKGNKPSSGKVPSTVLFLFDDDAFAGVFNIRHTLNDLLRQQGGHIGYEIIPSYRRRGYAKAGLKLTLNWCRDRLNLKKVLLFCEDKNIASEKTILSVMKERGGEALPPHVIEGHVKHGFWVKTDKNESLI